MLLMMMMMMMMLSHSAVVYNYVLGISLSARGLEFEAGRRYVLMMMMMMCGNHQQPEQETYQHWTRIQLLLQSS